MVKFNAITVVVQGPVHSFNGREQDEGITHRCLNSVRKYLPGAHIILSTWKNQDLAGLDFDELVECEDPGQNSRNINVDGKVQKYNNHRQIVSTLEGLKRVKTPYAVKLRSDNYLTSNAFVAMQQAYPARCEEYHFLKERVVVPNIFTRKFAKGHRVAFHVSDFFYFGLTEDLLALWNLPFEADFIPTEGQKYNPGYPDYVVDCTQWFFLKALQKFDATIDLKSLLDNRAEKIEQSEKCLANNLVVAEASEIGLGLCSKFLGKARVSRAKGRCAHYQYKEWQQLYRQYCDNEYNVDFPLLARAQLQFERCRYVYPTYLETKVKLMQRALKK
ncbi:WavE lipopolysaccharide synthesis family protein [Photobacterium japonica]|uniref:WavE lipopolysaccharide synthesis family protein n=1 Tax=Photobacterium japonica TaxID=2910235 RepID=UPI003D1133DA